MPIPGACSLFGRHRSESVWLLTLALVWLLCRASARGRRRASADRPATPAARGPRQRSPNGYRSPTVSGHMTVLIDKPRRVRARSRASLRRPRPCAGSVLLPGALTLGLAFRAGGFFPARRRCSPSSSRCCSSAGSRSPGRPFAGWSPALAVLRRRARRCWPAWTLLSALWSDAPLRAMLEFDRDARLHAGRSGCWAPSRPARGDLDRALRARGAARSCVDRRGRARHAPRSRRVRRPRPGGAVAARLPAHLLERRSASACAIGIVLALHCAGGRPRRAWRARARRGRAARPRRRALLHLLPRRHRRRRRSASCSTSLLAHSAAAAASRCSRRASRRAFAVGWPTAPTGSPPTSSPPPGASDVARSSWLACALGGDGPAGAGAAARTGA